MNRITIDELFEKRIIYPDPDCKDRLDRLVGLDKHKDQLLKMLSLMVNHSRLTKWMDKCHPKANKELLKIIFRSSPLVVLEGDVGCGKSELAETIGDTVARQEGIDITLFPLSLSTRGQGRVGEMTRLLSSSFNYIIDEAKKLKSNNQCSGGIIFLVDEADALAQSREMSQMHHEDRAGVNAFIRGVDQVKNEQIPVAILMCTNRLNALDPAIKRRSIDILTFHRPNELQRYSILKPALENLGFSEINIKTIVEMTGAKNGRSYGFTFSDLIHRLLFRVILDAYPNKAINPSQTIEIIKSVIPTPPFKEQNL